MEKVLTLFQLEVIMKVNFKMSILKSFVKKIEFTITFVPQEHLNKMVLWRGKNRSLGEGAKTLLNETKLPEYFWANAVSTI